MRFHSKKTSTRILLCVAQQHPPTLRRTTIFFSSRVERESHIVVSHSRAQHALLLITRQALHARTPHTIDPSPPTAAAAGRAKPGAPASSHGGGMDTRNQCRRTTAKSARTNAIRMNTHTESYKNGKLLDTLEINMYLPLMFLMINANKGEF